MSNVKIFEFEVPIECAACIAPVENSILALKASKNFTIEDVDVDPLDKVVSITISNSKVSDQEIKNTLTTAMSEVGFTPKYIEEDDDEKGEQHLASTKEHAFKGIVGLLAGCGLLGLCISGLAIPFFALGLIGIFSTLLTFYLGKDSYYAAAANLIKRKPPTMDTLFSISTLIAVVASFGSLFVPWLPMMFDTALLIFGFRHIGKAVEALATEEIKQNLNFRSHVAKEIEVADDNEKRGGRYSTKLIKDLKPGDIIKVAKGALVPVDGVCLNEASVYNTHINGNTLPEKMINGQTILAGAKLAANSEPLIIEVTATEKNSYLTLLDRSLRRARRDKNKAPLATFAKKVLKYFIPAVLALSFVAAIIIGMLFSPLTALQCAAAILVSACPCTFGLITPLAIKIGFIETARSGLKIKNGEKLQAAEQVDTVVFDLNGTLTTGIPTVVHSSIEKDKNLIKYLLALEKHAEHPFAKAIIEHFKETETAKNEIKVTEINKYHSGISGKIDGKVFTVGNEKMMIKVGI
ncbi:MAG TPA: HAD-IC family P-type ATPase, partial [Gammaproteobacteria bacterium]|nr:HAD-IC family P-type ATPase [Gammaproteobacteria bacterium]